MKKTVAVALACAGAFLICVGLRAAGKEMIKAIEDCGFFESIPLWAVTIIGSLFIRILSFIIIVFSGL